MTHMHSIHHEEPDTRDLGATGDPDIVFICGALRSGTTLLRLMVDQHPRLSNPGEMDFLFEYDASYDDTEALAHYAKEISRNRVFRALGLKIDPTLTYDMLVRSLVDQCRREGEILTINVHRNFQRIPDIFPDAGFIHLLRDPRDVARSSIGMGWAGNVYYGVDHWIASEKDFEALAGRISSHQHYELTFEDLVTEPEAALSGLCRFLGEQFDPEMLAYAQHSTYEKPDPAIRQQWRRKLSATEVDLIESKARPMMSARGYEPACPTSLAPNWVTRTRLAIDNRYRRYTFMLGRYGFGLTFLIALKKIAPVPAFRAYVRDKLANRDLEFLK